MQFDVLIIARDGKCFVTKRVTSSNEADLDMALNDLTNSGYVIFTVVKA